MQRLATVAPGKDAMRGKLKSAGGYLPWCPFAARNGMGFEFLPGRQLRTVLIGRIQSIGEAPKIHELVWQTAVV